MKQLGRRNAMAEKSRRRITGALTRLLLSSFLLPGLVLFLSGPVLAADCRGAVASSGVVVKRLSKSEIYRLGVSNQHEFNGVKNFCGLLGAEKDYLWTRILYVGDKNIATQTNLSWYHTKGGYFLYYPNNLVMDRADEGDWLVLWKEKPGSSLGAMILAGNHASMEKMRHLLGLEKNKVVSKSGVVLPNASLDGFKKLWREQAKKTPAIPNEFASWRRVEDGRLVIKGRISKITDGDTIELEGLYPIRLSGIDAPEKAQTCTRDGVKWRCGEAAKEHLEDIIGGRKITCVHGKRERGKYGRFLSDCKIGPVSVNQKMVRDGYALAYYGDAFKKDEEEARRKKRGIWESVFITPSEWRAGRRGKK